jgi:hypothetical protein
MCPSFKPLVSPPCEGTLELSIDTERKAAEKARGVLTLLAPSATYADHIGHPLRLAASVATSAMSGEPSAGAHLNYVRGDATGALDALIRALQTRTLTHKIVTTAKEAVDEWLAGLDAA